MTSKTPISLDGKQPDIIYSQQTWTDLFEQAFAVLDEFIRDPIEQLENIRIVNSASDASIIQWSLYQIGFHLPVELIVNHLPRLGNLIHMLSLYHELEGTENFYKVIRVLLNRSIDIEDLYTNDYEMFYRKANGALVIDGGVWYKTSHVNLFMEWLSTDNNIAFLKDKLLDAFYQYAPISMVVKAFMFQIDLKANTALRGVVEKDPFTYITIGDRDDIVSAYIDGPDEVLQATSAAYTLVLVRQSGTQTRYQFASWNTDLGVAKVNAQGTCYFGQVRNNLTIELTCTLLGQTATKDVTILDVGYNELYDIVITGPTQIVQGNSGVFSAVGVYSDGSTLPIEPMWIYSGTEATIDQTGLLITNIIKQTETVHVTAQAESIRGKHVITRAVPVELLYVPQNVHPIELQIVCDTVVVAGTTNSLTARIRYSDNSVVTIFPYWESSNGILVIDKQTQTFVTQDIAGEIVVPIYASISVSGFSLEQHVNITVQPLVLTPIQLFVLGPSTVIEKENHRYYAQVKWSNNTTNFVHPTWYTNLYSIDDNGTLHAGSTDQNINVVIEATFEANGITLVKQFPINVLKAVVSLDHISIIGPDYVHETEVAQYVAIGVYTDGKTSRITPTWSISVAASSFASIDVTGQLIAFSTPTVATGEITATFTVGAHTYTYTKQIVFVSNLNLVQSISISGATTVYEYEDITLHCTALMEDNTVVTVRPNWTVVSHDPVNFPDVDADIVNSSSGVLRGRPISEASEVIVQATYFRHVAQHSVVVLPKARLPVNTIETSLIIGPPVVRYGEEASFSHSVLYKDCSDYLLVSSDWSLNVDETIAEIDTNGYFISHSTVSRLVIITSTHENCPNQLDIRTLTVQLIGLNQAQDKLIIADSNHVTTNVQTVLSDNSTTQYTAVLQRENGTVQNVNAVWSVPGAPNGITVNGSGLLQVGDFTSPFQIMLQAIYSEGQNQFAANQLITIEIINPMFGVGPFGIDTDTEITQYLTTEIPSIHSGQTITVSLPTISDYGYFAHPAVLGTAVFTNISNGLIGGWDGATWPISGGYGNTTGPLTLLRTVNGVTQTWYLYRTDFSGSGTRIFRVDYIL